MKIHEKVKFAAPEKSEFFPTLKKRVDQYFIESQNTRYADRSMIIKTSVLLALYIVPFILLLTLQPPFWASLILWLLMGLGISGIGMSVMHDANHGAYSKNPSVNKWMGYSINLAGAGVDNWKFQHNILHHTYTNVVPMDEDIRDRGIVKLSPHHEPKRVHRFQYLYAFAFYGILTLYWVLLKDFIQYHGFIKSGVNRKSTQENRRMLLGLILMKSIYLFAFFGVPIFLFQLPWLEVVAGFLLMHFTAGTVLTVIFQLAHTVEGTSHPMANEQGIIEKDWAIHQLETTVNFSPRNKWLSWYIGGLNFQIEHHLFPKICHVHYPEIAPIVKKTAHEFGLVYQENATFMKALRSHIMTLHRFGSFHDLNEAIG
ncbi:acyl-CoA desaturase [Telluribacter sp. SYSU D00476]|uniref:fatty acid desaturase family protein n=1 Tax=Telluribacter sp. SYSU D00476 TaxID=2811430 RepID=UPI001FF6C881|nr:acyl-CoA desaturase [Telluribacter sp. SYSU D00476]